MQSVMLRAHSHLQFSAEHRKL